MTQGNTPAARFERPRQHRTRPRCIWPKCHKGSAIHLNLPVCQTHADAVYDAVANDIASMVRVVQERQAAEAAKKVPAKKAKPRVDVIYYLRNGGNIKIGWTSQLEQRMRAYPPDTILLAVHPGTRDDERELHRRFKVHRSHGNEWYPLAPVIIEHIKRMVAEHGEPPTTSFGAKPYEVPRPMQQKPNLGTSSAIRLVRG